MCPRILQAARKNSCQSLTASCPVLNLTLLLALMQDLTNGVADRICFNCFQALFFPAYMLIFHNDYHSKCYSNLQNYKKTRGTLFFLMVALYFPCAMLGASLQILHCPHNRHFWPPVLLAASTPCGQKGTRYRYCKSVPLPVFSLFLANGITISSASKVRKL